METYSVETCKQLQILYRNARLHRPMRINRYDAGDHLTYQAFPVASANPADRVEVELQVKRFVGGGFAGQVYQVSLDRMEPALGSELKIGKAYALKILIPPTRFSMFFRNLLYAIGFQAPFQLQVNPAAARAGAIWQKFIRRGAQIRFGCNDAVNNVHLTLVDPVLGSCGELSDWIDGRTWRLEVDERMDVLKRWRKRKPVDPAQLGSPEYRAKRRFMYDFVKLLHDMGAHEFARQYEWSTCKSQPNCLKRMDTDHDPTAGLLAVDFRAGLTLLPFLPMSPGDIKLILQGLCRASLVQFDRGNLHTLRAFMDTHGAEFEDMRPLLGQLEQAEQAYRNSMPDITHNRLRLLYSRSLWSTMLKSAITGWRIRNLVDDQNQQKLRNSTIKTMLFALLGCIPIAGRVLRKAWMRSDWRQHYAAILISWNYLTRACKGKMAEAAIVWHRAGRLELADAIKVASSLGSFLLHKPLSILPTGLHKFLTNWNYFKDRLDYILARPIRLYFKAEQREQWLRDMVGEGKTKGIVSDEDAVTILSRIKEPFIQKYLKSLAVHVCTLPVTQIVSVAIALIYVWTHPEMPKAQSWGIGLGIIALFQVVPISPGSLTRGLYVVYLAITEKNFKDYNIAIFLGFFKYVGYLAFPIQMTYRYPTLARFMATHWATDFVHMIPVFGESGALLERWVFCLFYNWPLTIRKRMTTRAQMRAQNKPRYWHVPLLCVIAAALFVGVQRFHQHLSGVFPTLKDIWYAVLVVPFLLGLLTILGASGASLAKRVIAAVVAGLTAGMLSVLAGQFVFHTSQLGLAEMLPKLVWSAFLFTIICTIGAILTELKLPHPDLKQTTTPTR